jgi:hypothetical protein
MIIIDNSTFNRISVTTHEKVIPNANTGTYDEDVYYIIKLTDKLNGDEIIFLPIGGSTISPFERNYTQDISPYPNRYNKFAFEFGLVDDNVNGLILDVADTGQWNYEIYYSYGTLQTTNPVIISGSSKLCESGIALIK